MNTLKLFTSPVGLAVLPTITKSVGSFFRSTIDYRNAPPDVYRNEIKREVSLLSLAFASNLAIQLVAARTFPRLLPKVFPKIAKDPSTLQAVNLLSRFALTVPATVMAESISRIIGKPPTWKEGEEEGVEEAGNEHEPAAPQNEYAERDDEYETGRPEFRPAELPRPIPNPFAAAPSTLMAGIAPAVSAVPLMYYGTQQPAPLTRTF